jgi:thiol:disulfide interchange protein
LPVDSYYGGWKVISNGTGGKVTAVKNLDSARTRILAWVAFTLLPVAMFTAIMSALMASEPVVAQGSGINAIHNAPVRALSNGLVWQRDLRRALKEAKASDKMILVDVYTDWCGPCKMLDTNTYSSPDVVMFLRKNFICVKVNAEDPTLGNWVSAKYEIDGYPSIVVLASNGKQKGKFVGYCGPQRFLSEVNKIVTK